MRLSEILDNVKVRQVTGYAEKHDITSLDINSGLTHKHSLFFAIRGFKTDGHKYIPEAVSNGAKAVVLDTDGLYPDEFFDRNDVVRILVEDSRKSLAEISDIFYGKASEKLRLTGITGTKGKTTFTYFLSSINREAGRKSGVIGTINNWVGDRKIDTKLTTPEANMINRLLSEMADEGCADCIMEVSSHALELRRVDFLDFDTAVFSNITSDHLDFHASFQEYRDAKKKLFDSLKPEASVIINADDKNHEYMVKDTEAKVFTVGAKPECDFFIDDIKYDLSGTGFTLSFEGEKYPLFTSLIGPFNAYNASLAFAAAVVNGVDPETALRGIKNTPQVDGRFEVISSGEKKVIIDYSHTAGSLTEALNAIHAIKGKDVPVYTVFGCGGDRDKFKRPEMGKIASEKSDRAIVTSDNPRSEDPYAIIRDITAGMVKENYKVIENREEAIKEAVTNSENNAVVLIAGKGHETYQEIKGIRNYFSDKDTAKKYLGINE